MIRYITLLLLLTFTTLFSQDYADKIDAAFDNYNAPLRGKIEENSGEFKLHYYDKFEKDPSTSYLTGKGYQGGGASWLAIIYSAFAQYEKNLLDSVKYEVEISGVSFTSDNTDDLVMISKVIGLVKADKAVLDALISEAEKLKIMK